MIRLNVIRFKLGKIRLKFFILLTELIPDSHLIKFNFVDDLIKILEINWSKKHFTPSPFSELTNDFELILFQNIIKKCVIIHNSSDLFLNDNSDALVKFQTCHDHDDFSMSERKNYCNGPIKHIFVL